MAANDVEIGIGSRDNSAPALDAVKARLDELGKKAVTASVDVNDKAAQHELDLFNAKLAETGKKVASPKIDVAGWTRAYATLSGLELQLDKINDSSATARASVDTGDSAPKLGLLDGLLDKLGSKSVSARVSVNDSGFAGRLAVDAAAADGFSASMMKWPAVIGGAMMLLPALPGLIAGVGAAAGVAALAFGPVMKAMSDSAKAASASAASQGKSSAQVAQTEQANAQAIVSAQQSVTDARTQAAHDAITSAESVKNAESAVASAEEQAAQNVAGAEQQLQEAQYNEKQAQLALTQARQDAVRQLQALRDAEKDTALNVKQSRLDLQQAEENQQKVDSNSKSTLLERKQADLAVQEAEQHLKEAIEARKNAAQDAQKGDKDGVNGAPGVIQARHNVAEAEKAQAQAAKNLAQTEKDSAKAIAQAVKGLADAERSSSWQRAADAEHVGDAQRNLKDTYKQQGLAAAVAAGAGSASAAAFAQDMASLTPAARKFVTQLEDMKDGYHKLQGDAESAIFPGLSKFLGGIKGLMPIFGTEVKKMGGLLGGAFGDAGKAMESSGVKREIKDVLDEGNKVMSILLPAIGKLGGAFLDAGAKSGPAVTGIAKAIASVAKGMAGLLKGLSGSGTSSFGAIFSSIGIIISGLGKPLGTIVSAIATGFAPALKQVAPMVTALANGLAKVISAIPAPVMAAFITGVLAVVTAIKAWTIAQGALDLVMDANPFVLIGIAVVALAVLIVKYHKQIWDTIKKVWGDILDFLKQWWPLLLGVVTGGLGLIIGVIIKYHKQIWDAIKNAWNNITGWIHNTLDDLRHWFASKWDQVFGDVKDFYTQKIPNAIRSGWNDVVNWVHNKLDDFRHWISSKWDDIGGDLSTFFTKTIPNTVSSGWNDTINWVHGKLNDFQSFLSGKWSSIGNDAKKGWNALENIFKKPVNFLIGTVYDNGIRRLWNDVVNAVGANSLDLPNVATLSKGGKLGGYGGGDVLPALLEPGETVVSKEHSPKLAGAFAAVGVPGYATGGIIGEAGAAAKMGLAIATGNEVAFSNAFSGAVSGMFGGGGASGGMKTLMTSLPVKLIGTAVKGAWDTLLGDGGPGSGGGGAGGSGGDIVSYARSWLKKIPYVFGGTSTSGDDCSGFTQMVYKHFGYNSIPRTSEEQGAWVTKTAKPQAGGLAFFNSPAGGPPPGHVGIITGTNSMISQPGPEGALGPVNGTIAGNMWVGVPPGGFTTTGGGKGGTPSQNIALAKQMYPAWAAGEKWREWNYIAEAESGWRDDAKNASGAFGIAQALGHGASADRGSLSDSYGGYGLSHAQAKAANSADAGDQIAWMHNYILDKFGSIKGAYNYHVAHGNYGTGGIVGGGGFAQVGEFGRELVKLPQGSTVMPHGQSESALGGGACNHRVELEISSSGQSVDEALLQLVRKSIRIRGGNVQAVLGH